jgi:hypothetical protein
MLWSTEICYGHVLATASKDYSESSVTGVWEAFNHAETQAWYPNRQGEQKYKSTVQQFLTDVRENMSSIHRPLMLQFYASFETYLRNRVGALSSRKEKRLAPLLLALSDDLFTQCEVPLRIASVINGDICRLARNAVAHNDELPDSHKSPIAKKWRLQLETCHDALKAWNASRDQIDQCVRKITFEIDRQVSVSPEKGRKLSHEFFFALFSFTILDQLASEVEEALMKDRDSDNWIWRPANSVRRMDLILAGNPEQREPLFVEDSLVASNGLRSDIGIKER